MDVGTLLTMTQTFLQLLDSSIMKEIESVWNFRSQLEEMKGTMSTIKAVLLDAERQERQLLQRSHADRDWLEKLSNAVYQADDLFDEVATLAQREMLMSGSKVSKKVRLFFSCTNNPLLFARNISQEISKIRKMLDGIAKDGHEFGSRGLEQQVSDGWTIMKRERADTHSFVRVENVVGRDDEKTAVIDILLDESIKELDNVSFVTIVGIGGLGKTTLAQLVYNDEKIQREFSTKLWVCVCDQENFDAKAIVAKILEAATGSKCDEKLGMDQLQCQLRQQIDGKKTFLVLDDMWTEDRHEWLKLRELLTVWGKGSRVLVTSRSKRVAYIIGSGRTYELKGLSEEDSWRLFEKMAFGDGQESMDPDLVAIGKEVVKKCANVPLAIRVIGSLLYGQSKSRWQSFRNVDLASLKQDGGNILPILKLSYYHLPYHLKTCFNNCAIFPKDYHIEKQTLISLWMAQGFIFPSCGQSIEDIGEEYFTTLLQRCFFQDVGLSWHGDEICSFKIHDLMHDVAQEEAGERISVAGSSASHLSEKICHVAFHGKVNLSIVSCLAKRKRLRTFLKLEVFIPNYNYRLLLGAKFLRVLDLKRSSFKRLPSTISQLLHLRYLDLSWNNKLEMIPMSITKLHNLQTLKLDYCSALKVLPRDLSKLVNLRHLDIFGCSKLTHMPPGMNNLTGLHTLPLFVVGEARATYGTSSGKKVPVGQLEDLEALINLRGELEINVLENSTIDVAKVKVAGCTRSMEHLRSLSVYICRKTDDDHERDEALLQGLEPHPNLKRFELDGYRGVRLPRWDSMNNLGTSPANLVCIRLYRCTRLQYLPLLSQLRYLEELELNELTELKYVDSSISGEAGLGVEAGSVHTADRHLLFFPSLETLTLEELPKLEGWWSSSREGGVHHQGKANDDGSGLSKRQQSLLLLPSYPSSFPRLHTLTIKSCPKLTSIPLCPSVRDLNLQGFNETLELIVKKEYAPDASSYTSLCTTSSYSLSSPPPSSSSSSNATIIISTNSQQPPKLEEVKISNVAYLNSLPVESFQVLSKLCIISDDKLESLAIADIIMGSCRSSLRILRIHNCPKLKSLSGGEVVGWEHPTALESLELDDLPELVLDISEEEEEYRNGCDMPWRCLHHSLLSLKLQQLPKLRNLPKGMRYLTSLQSLEIFYCQGLEALPEWIGCLSALQSLKIRECQQLQSLPEEMKKLTSLSRLDLWRCAPGMKERCQKPTGQDWLKIQHIPHISILGG